MNDLDISREEFVARLAEIRHVVRKLKKSQEEVEKTKELLAQSAEWHRAWFDAATRAGLGIGILQDLDDREAAIVFVNEELRQMLGYSSEELVADRSNHTQFFLQGSLFRGRRHTFEDQEPAPTGDMVDQFSVK